MKPLILFLKTLTHSVGGGGGGVEREGLGVK